MANDPEAVRSAQKDWGDETERLDKAIGEVYRGNSDICHADITFENVRAYSERAARAAEHAGNSKVAKGIRSHFRARVAPAIAKFERVKDCAVDMAECLERRRAAENSAAYEFNSSMAKGHLGEIEELAGCNSGLFNSLRFDFFRDSMLNVEIAEKLGLAKIPPKSGEYRRMEKRLYEIVEECSREFDIRGTNPDGTPWTDKQKEEHDRQEAAKVSLVARGMPSWPEKAMEMFIAFGAQSLALIANGKQPVANLPNVMIGYATYSYIAFMWEHVPHDKTLADALSHDFGVNGKEFIAAESLCHNHTVIYLRKGLDLEEAQAKAREDLAMLDSVE